MKYIKNKLYLRAFLKKKWENTSAQRDPEHTIRCCVRCADEPLLLAETAGGFCQRTLKRFGRDKSLSEPLDGRGLFVLESARPFRPESWSVIPRTALCRAGERWRASLRRAPGRRSTPRRANWGASRHCRRRLGATFCTDCHSNRHHSASVRPQKTKKKSKNCCSSFRRFWTTLLLPSANSPWLTFTINSPLNSAPTRWFSTARTSRCGSSRSWSWERRSCGPATATCRSQTRRQKKVKWHIVEWDSVSFFFSLVRVCFFLSELWNTWCEVWQLAAGRLLRHSFQSVRVPVQKSQALTKGKRWGGGGSMNGAHSCCSHAPGAKVADHCGSARSEALNMWRSHVGTSVKNSAGVRSCVPVVTIRLKPSPIQQLSWFAKNGKCKLMAD